MQDHTIDYYNSHSDDFIADTVTAYMTVNQDRFLSHLMQNHPSQDPSALKLLDFGCGSGRDTKYFLSLGYDVSALDGSEELCRHASQYTGIPVRHMYFQDFRDTDAYDGIWACASILHLGMNELPAVLRQMAAALKPHGSMYITFKYGSFEGNRNGRYYTDLDEQRLARLLSGIPDLKLSDQWITGDVRPGREQEKWLNAILDRI